MKVKIVKVSNIHFDEIKVPRGFIDNPPTPEKLIHKVLVFNRESELDDIYVDEHFYLEDGYCSYLIAQQVGAEFVKINMVRGKVQ